MANYATAEKMARDINKLISKNFDDLVGQGLGMRTHGELFRLNDYNSIDDDDDTSYINKCEIVLKTIKDYLNKILNRILDDNYYIAFIKIGQKNSKYNLNNEMDYHPYSNACYLKDNNISRASDPLKNLISFSQQPGFSLGTVLTSNKYDTYAIRIGFCDNNLLQYYQHIWNTTGRDLNDDEKLIYNDLEVLSKIASRTFAIGDDTRTNISEARNNLQEEIFCCIIRYVLNNKSEISDSDLHYMTNLDVDTAKNKTILNGMIRYATNLRSFFQRKNMLKGVSKFLVIPTAIHRDSFIRHPNPYEGNGTLGLYDYNPAYNETNNPVMMDMLKINNVINNITTKLGKFALYRDYITPADAYLVDETELDDIIKTLEDIEKRIDNAIADKEDGDIMAFHNYLQLKKIVGVSLKKNSGYDPIRAINYRRSAKFNTNIKSGVNLNMYYNVSFSPHTRPQHSTISASYKLMIEPKNNRRDPLKTKREYILNIRSNSAGDNITMELQCADDMFFAGKMMTFFNKTLDKVGFENNNLFIDEDVNIDNVNKDDDVYNDSLKRIANALGTPNTITMKGIRAFCKRGDMKAVNDLYSAYCDTMIELADNQDTINGILSSYADDKVTTPKLVQVYMLYYTLWHIFFNTNITKADNVVYKRATGRNISGRSKFLSNYIRDFIATGLRTNILNASNSGFAALPYIK